MPNDVHSLFWVFFACYHSVFTSKMDKLQSIYYQPSHLWKGQKAVKELQELSKEKPKGWEEVPTEVIYCFEKVGQITTKSERVIMVVSLVDEDGTNFKVFPNDCLENDLRDFGWGEEWFIKSLGKRPSSRDPDQSYYYYEIMWRIWFFWCNQLRLSQLRKAK